MKKTLLITIILIITMVTPLMAGELLPPEQGENVWDLINALQNENQQQREQIRALQEQLAQQGEGNIRLVTPQNITLESGDTLDISLTIRNVGSHNVRSLFTLASPSEGSPFTVEFLNNSNSYSSVGANSQRTMTMQISVDENAEPGNHTISLSHFFRDDANRTQTSSDTINVRIGGVGGEPSVRLGNFSTTHTGSLSQGQMFTVSAEIQNLGNAAARDVRIDVPNNRRVEDNIFLSNGDDLNRASFTTMAQGFSGMLNFTFTTSSEIETGSYPIPFHITFKDESGKEFGPVIVPFTVTVFAPENNNETAILEIREMSVPTGRINVAQTGRISFFIYNNGEVEARNIRVEATPDNEQAIVPTSTNIQVIPSLAPGENREVVFNFSPTDKAVTRSYPIRLRTSYQVGRGGEPTTFDQFAGFNVFNPDEEEDDTSRSQIPRVIVSEYVLEPSVPRAGHEFEMTITFRNTNATRSVNNVRILMEEVLSSNPGQQQNHFAGFTPVGGSNTLFIENMRPHSEETMVLRFTTSAEATSGTHNMKISFDYQDDTFETHTAFEQISISVAQVTRMELADVNVMEFASVGDSVWFSFTIINSGRVNLSNIRVRTEGPFDVTEAGRFVGPLNAQRTAGFDGRFVPLEPGQHQGEFIITGEDTTGALVELVHPFNITVSEGWGMDGDFMGGDWDGAWGGDRFPPMFGDFEMDGDESETSFPSLVIILIVVGVVAVIIVASVIIIRKRKSKLNFDDED